MPPFIPYLVHGKVFQSDGVTASSGTTVSLQYEPTGEVMNTITNSLGQYVFDLANLPLGYEDLNYFRVNASGSTSSLHDLRLRVRSRSTAQIKKIAVEYTT